MTAIIDKDARFWHYIKSFFAALKCKGYFHDYNCLHKPIYQHKENQIIIIIRVADKTIKTKALAIKCTANMLNEYTNTHGLVADSTGFKDIRCKWPGCHHKDQI